MSKVENKKPNVSMRLVIETSFQFILEVFIYII
jgi:hypothetical protein